MSLDLYRIAFGEPPISDKPRNAAARVVCSRDGRLLCTLTRDREGQYQAAMVGIRQTRPHTAEWLIDCALGDFEAAATDNDQACISATGAFFAALEAVGDPVQSLAAIVPSLQIPPRVRTLAGLPAAIASEAARASAVGAHPHHIAGFDVTCPKCRDVWYLGDDLASWLAESARERKRVVLTTGRPAMAPQRTHAQPAPDRRSQRSALYMHLSTVLESNHNKRIPAT